VFVGGWTLEAAAVVTETANLGVEALDVLGALVDKSLIQVQTPDSAAQEPRFRMLETLREYALDQLTAAGELEATYSRYVGFFVELAEVGEPRLRCAEQAVWLERLETEHDNFRAALGWSLSSGPVTEPLLRLGWALGCFWFLHGHYSEGRRWLEHLLEHSPGASPLLRARLLARAGTLAHGQGDLSRAAALLEESLALARAEGDTWLVAFGLTVWGFVAEFQGDHARGQQFTQESLALFRQLNDVWGIGWALHQLGPAAHDQGEFEQAEGYLNESLGLWRALGDSWGLALVLHYLGRVAHARGAQARARALQEESLALSRRLGFKRYIAWALHHLARVARAQGEYRQARAYEEESLASAIQRGDKPGMVECVEGLAGLAVAQGDWTRAARLASAVEALREALGCPRPRAYQPGHERDLAAVRAALGEHSFHKHWVTGRCLSLEEAIAEAGEPAVAGLRSEAPPLDRSDPLTGPEREVWAAPLDGHLGHLPV
jgi:tetratricopeptide (TPR) repeat protein